MENILVTLPVEDRNKKRLEMAAPKAEFTYVARSEETKEQVQQADIILGNVNAEFLDDKNQLRWLQLDSAGTEKYCDPGRLPKDAVLTNATGAYGVAISEHMIAMLFMLQKHMEEYYIQQKNHQWSKLEPMLLADQSTTLVIGLGNIGSNFARRMKAMGSYVIGIRRSSQPKPDYVDEQYTMEKLHSLLLRADVVALSLPAYTDTKGILGREEFELMKDTAVLLNVGRGSAVDTDALNEALCSGKIYGAGLDVVDPEPLAKEHPLWDAPHTIITPHASGGYQLPATLERIIDLSVRNLQRYENGEALENQVDFYTGYVKRA